MRVAPRFEAPLLIASVLVSSACHGESTPAVVYDARSRDASAIAATPPDPETLAAAERVLRAFLDASRESTLDPSSLDTLGVCGDGGQSYFPSTLLAGYTLLPFESRGDTIVGRAEVVTVAEVDIDRRARDVVHRARARPPRCAGVDDPVDVSTGSFATDRASASAAPTR
jgi:hypothetical protein